MVFSLSIFVDCNLLLLVYRSLVSYSDFCGRQNKNSTIIGLNSELHHSSVFLVLDHKNLVRRGHTFLENDTDFSQIEKRKKSAIVYLPDDWFRVIQEANKRKLCVVTEMKPAHLRIGSPTSVAGINPSLKTQIAIV